MLCQKLPNKCSNILHFFLTIAITMWKLLVEVKQEWKEIWENFKNGVYWNEDFIKSTIYIFIWLMFLIFSIFTCLVRKIGSLRF